MDKTKILISGFGGQGILFLGKLIATTGLFEEKEVSWLPSYGPEMRGGTANCSVIISDETIGSPIVSNPDVLISMNLPSFQKYEKSVEKNGKIFFDSSLINAPCDRKDINYFGIDATALADENGLHGLANMVILGKILKEYPFLPKEAFKRSIEKTVAGKPELLEKNLKAIEIGFSK